jgi:Fe2+ transport system protein FeoA
VISAGHFESFELNEPIWKPAVFNSPAVKHSIYINSGKIVLGGRVSVKRLADLGITSGKEIKVLRKALFSGPVQIEVCGSRLVIGRGMASRIFVELK